jgi:hypothetical protein
MLRPWHELGLDYFSNPAYEMLAKPVRSKAAGINRVKTHLEGLVRLQLQDAGAHGERLASGLARANDAQ